MRVPRPLLPEHRQAEARAIGRRTHQTFLFAAATGVIVGAVVLVIERVTVDGLLESVAEQPLWIAALAPLVGLLVTVACLRLVCGDTSTATAEEYVRSFHEQGPERFDPRTVVGRVLASVATIGYGGALGLEGPSIYAGSAIGAAVQRRFARYFSREDAKLLLVAGAAAGVAAIFKAPATGALFAIEVPYRADVARRNVLPAMVAAATGYMTFAVVDGTKVILPVAGNPPFDWRDIGGALLVGVLCGVGARLFSAALRAIRTAPRITGIPWTTRVAAAGVALAALAVLANAVADRPLTLGPGYDAVEWATDPGHSVWLVLAILVLRVGAVMATFGGGGVGGLFIPLVVTGALTGRVASDALGMSDADLLMVVGMAAFLGAGYRTPLAALMFVAETTGRPGFVVPALVATAASQLVVGESSVSVHQRAGRLGHLERRFELPISSVISTDVRTVPPDATIEEFLSVHLVGQRRRSVPVVDDANRYLGLAVLDEVVAIRREAWASTDIRTIARMSAPGRTTWLVRDAVQAMERADSDVLAVVDSDDRFVGVVTTDEVLRLDEILERTGLR
ncbi:MAG TPA: chloride channel protein [Acidimicrobiales bacterium]|nr:chloride channel protein [Acidimicrobiales bacterium]